MMIRFLMLVLFVILSDIYFYQAVRRIMLNRRKVYKTLVFYIYWGITVTGVAILIISGVQHPKYASNGLVKYTFTILLILAISKLIGALPVLVDDIRRLVKLIRRGADNKNKPEEEQKHGKITRSMFISRVAMGFMLVPFATFIHGMLRTAFDFTVRKVNLKLPNLPDNFVGLKIVQISDIHTGSFVSTHPFEKAIKLINEQKPDIILFTGDLVNNVTTEADHYLNILSTIKAPMGVYSTLGNHDYGDYVEWPSPEAKQKNL